MNDFVKRFEELVRNDNALRIELATAAEEKSRLRDELIDLKGDLNYKLEQYDLLETRFMLLTKQFNELNKEKPNLKLQSNVEVMQVLDSDLIKEEHNYYDYWDVFENDAHFGERF